MKTCKGHSWARLALTTQPDFNFFSEVGFKYEQDSAYYNVNNSSFRLEAFFFKQVRPFVEFQTLQNLVGVSYYKTILNDKLAIKLHIDSFANKK